jgi:hypothetical protein
MKNLTKILATGAMATLLLPTLAFANEGGLKARGDGNLQLRIEHQLDKVEKKEVRNDKHDEKHDARRIKSATTTAAAITKQGVRIQAAADTMLSFNTRVEALIASSSTDGKAALEAQFAAFKTAGVSAKVEASNAITGVAAVNANNSTTTNASIIATAKVDLKQAKGFLHDAKEAFFYILRTLWN